jgi:hypothetical protein
LAKLSWQKLFFALQALVAIEQPAVLWQYGLWSFQMGDTKLERFLTQNQHTKRKLLNVEFWINHELSKSAKI